MRTRYSFYNFVVNLITSVILPILGFVKLSLFLGLYGVSVNGLQITIAQIITFLNVCEIAYSLAFRQLLFKPLADKDKQGVLSIYYGAKRVFNITGTIVLILGFVLSIFFPLFADSPFDYFNTSLIFLISTLPYGISYFLMGPNFVIIADQKEYKINIWIQSIAILRMILMIIAIILKMDFYVIVIIEVLNILIANIIARFIALKAYPWLKEKPEAIDNKSFIKNAKYTIIQRLSALATNNTDNIVITSFMGYAMSGVYGVYSYLNEFVYKIVNSVISSTINSFGNLFNDENADSYKVFTEFFNFACYGASIVSVCIFVVMADFIPIVMRKTEIGPIPFNLVLMFSINIFYLTMREPVIISRDANGLFKDAKNNAYLLAISKIVLSVTMVRIWGLAGVIGATLITNWTVDFLYNPRLVYKKVFKLDVIKYYKMVFSRVVITAVIGAISYYVWNMFIEYVTSGTVKFLISCVILGIVVLITFTIIYYVLYESYRNLIRRIYNLFVRRMEGRTS